MSDAMYWAVVSGTLQFSTGLMVMSYGRRMLFELILSSGQQEASMVGYRSSSGMLSAMSNVAS